MRFLLQDVIVPSDSLESHRESQTMLCCICDKLQNGLKRGSAKYEHRPVPIRSEVAAKFFDLPLAFIGESGSHTLRAHKRCLLASNLERLFIQQRITPPQVKKLNKFIKFGNFTAPILKGLEKAVICAIPATIYDCQQILFQEPN